MMQTCFSLPEILERSRIFNSSLNRVLFNEYDTIDEQANELSQLLVIISPLVTASAQQPINQVRSVLSQLVLSSLQSFKTTQRENGPSLVSKDGLHSYFPSQVDIDSIMQSVQHFNKKLEIKQQNKLNNTQQVTLQKDLVSTIKPRQRQTKINFNTNTKPTATQQNHNNHIASKRKLKNNELIYNDLLCHIFSFINCLQFPKLEIVCHQFFQCIRSPMSITHINSEFLQKMCNDDPYTTNMLKRIYDTNTKMNGTIEIKEREFLHNNKVFFTNQQCMFHTKSKPWGECYRNGNDYLDRKIQIILSHLNLTQETVKTVMKLVFGENLQRVAIIKRNDKNEKTKELSVSNVGCCPLAMIALRGIEYCGVPRNDYLDLDFENQIPCFFNNCDYLWYHFDYIQSMLLNMGIKDVRISILIDESAASLFVILSLFLHPNIESIDFQCFGPTDDNHNTNMIESNKIKYKQKIPKLSKLKNLTLNSFDCNRNGTLFVRDGHAFCNALISNTEMLEKLEFQDWYKTWIVFSDDWILNNYKTLKHLIFNQEDECAPTKFNDKESWIPVCFIKRMIDIYENKIKVNYQDKIRFWFENVLQQFKFRMTLYNPHVRMDVEYYECVDRYHDEYKQDIDQIDKFVRLVLYVKGFFQRLNIENDFIIDFNYTCWNVQFYEQHFDGLATFIDQESWPQLLEIGANYKIDPTQCLLSKWFK